MSRLAIKCKICDTGALENKRIYRMSGPSVEIGYILLIPSICGIAFCALFIINIELRPSQRYVSANQAAVSEMRENDVPEEVISQVVAYPRRDPAGYINDPGIPMYQFSWVKDATKKLRDGSPVLVADDNATRVGQALAERMYFFLGVMAFVSGLLGWLLVMKERVLQCCTCSAVVNAS
jgi:hypothetical protein